MPFQVIIILIVSSISYKYIESPFRKVNLFSSNKKTVLTSLVFISSCFALFFSSISLLSKSILFTGVKRNIFKDDFSEYIEATSKKCRDIEINSKCITYKSQTNNRQIFLMGDSHAGHLIPLIGNIHQNYNLDIIFFTGGGFYPYQYYVENNGKDLTENIKIEKIRNKAFNIRFDKLKNGDIILLSSSFDLHFFNNNFSFEERSRGRTYFSKDKKIISPQESYIQYLEDLKKLAIKADKKGINIVIFSPLPIFKYFENAPSGFICKKQWFRPNIPKNCQEDFSTKKIEILERFEIIFSGLDSISKSTKNTFIYSPFNQLCPEEMCFSKNNGMKIFRDNNHLSREGSISLENNFIKFLKENNLI